MTPWQMLRQPSFYVIYLMMTMLAFGGLVVTAQLNPMASSYHVDKIVVAFGMTALVLAITVDRILNGFTRPFWGWVSDNIGRENSIFIAFVLEALAVYALLQLINRPVWFVVLSGLCFFAWGNIFSLFPSRSPATCTEEVGDHQLWNRVHRQGSGCGFAGPGAAWLFSKTGSWTKVFWAMIVCDLVAAFMALLWLKPMARAGRQGAALTRSVRRPEQFVDMGAFDVQSRRVEIGHLGNPSDRCVVRMHLTVAALEDPLQHPAVLTVTRP
jgi:MFS transporter, OFA family, oxalate/formate antiporter